MKTRDSDHNSNLPMSGLVFRPVTRETKDDFVVLFDRPGWQKQCWCMVWRATAQESSAGRSSSIRREQMLGRIEGGTPVGLLGYFDDEPIAWVAVAPKHTFRKLGGPEPVQGDKVWSLVCMYIRREYRGNGLADELIAGAAEHAKRSGGSILEAYPVDPESPSYGYMGFIPAFQRAGFVDIGMAGSRRHVMRLLL